MTAELIQQVKAKFPGNKIFLFSTSWGSILSARLLESDPHAVDGVVACGQIIKVVFFSDEVKDTLAQSKIPEKKLERIKQLTADNFTGQDLQLISVALRKYTDAYQNKSGTTPPMGTIIKGLLTSPDYSFKDFIAIMVNGYRENTSLWQEIAHIDLSSPLGHVEIPYIILQGDTDIVASTRLVKELVESSKNRNLHCRIVPKTGHMPSLELMDSLLAALEDISSR